MRLAPIAKLFQFEPAMQPLPEQSRFSAAPVRRSISGIHFALLPATAYEVEFVSEAGSLGFAFDSQVGSHAIGSDRLEPYSRLPNSLALTPSGCDVRSSSKAGGEYLLISGSGIKASPGRYRTNIQDPGAYSAASEIRKWLLGGLWPDDLEVERVIGHLQRAALRPSRPAKAARWMTPQRFRRLTDRIETSLDEILTVARLAAEIGVSPSFLSRAFTAFCGQSPYDYILSRRVQKARVLIAESTLPLAEIAVMAGFSSQSHMSASLRTRLALSPSAIRRGVR